jgi:hypothetical protein
MDAMTDFELADGYAVFRPTGQLTLDGALTLLSAAITHARKRGISKLLIDTTALEGFNPTISTWDRYRFAEQLARAAMSSVVVAMVAHPELIDARRFGVTVARNRGMMSAIFATEAAALEWLLDPQRT